MECLFLVQIHAPDGCFVLLPVSKFELIEGGVFTPAPLWKLQWPAIIGAMGLGFCLSLLFFMDHNIAGAIINSADNRCAPPVLCFITIQTVYLHYMV